LHSLLLLPGVLFPSVFSMANSLVSFTSQVCVTSQEKTVHSDHLQLQPLPQPFFCLRIICLLLSLDLSSSRTGTLSALVPKAAQCSHIEFT
jgi:hypothetical protein